MNIHEFIRPSTLAGIEACNVRPTMEAHATDILPALATWSSPIAEQGTKAHDIAAQTLALIYHGPVQQDPAAALAKMAGGLATLEPWAADAARRCVAYVVALVDQMKAEGLRVKVEVEMHLSGQGFNVRRGGTADVVLLGFDGDRLVKVVVEDHKTGFLDQGHAADHLQLHTYAGMAWDRYAKAGPVRMEVHLAQGRRREFSAASFKPEDIDRIRARVMAVVAAALKPSPEARPGIDQCRYCRALTLCRAARSAVDDAIEEWAYFGTKPEALALVRRFADAAQETAALWRDHKPSGMTTHPQLHGDSNEERAKLAELAANARAVAKAARSAA